MKRFFRNNGLSIVFGTFFAVFMVGQAVTGFFEYNDDQREHQRSQVSYVEYLMTPHFVEATMENWESEFLQMFLFVALTAFLYQKGSAESKKIGEKEKVDRDPSQSKNKAKAPWPVRKGGLVSEDLCELIEPDLRDTVLTLLRPARSEVARVTTTKNSVHMGAPSKFPH